MTEHKENSNIQTILELTGVLSGPQLVHHDLDLTSCHEKI